MKNLSFFLCLLVAMSNQAKLSLASSPVNANTKHDLIGLRKLGHLLLLTSGDSASTVLPVLEMEKGTYSIRFEKPFRLIPDSLVEVVTRLTRHEGLSGKYSLTVVERGSDQIVYGFTSEDIENGTAPCLGRAMPSARYEINIQYHSGHLKASNPNLPLYSTLFSVLFIAGTAVGFGIYQTKQGGRKVTQVAKSVALEVLPLGIGNFVFYPSSQLLTQGKDQFSLTPKEQTLLLIFLQHPNEVIDRSLLLKLGWEDQGVITGRSLDMYVSKLRKKFAADPAISFRNVHGKGYSMSIGNRNRAENRKDS